jgi:phage terminase large subunit GpA-like protein
VQLTPYIVDYVRAFENHLYDTVALVCGSQMGKSEADLDVIGQTLDQRPAPIIYVAPSETFLREEIEPRLTSLIEQSASLKAKASGGKKSTKYKKIVAGVAVRLLWAGSASQLSGTTAKLALVDELDRMVSNVQGDGDPLTLVDARGFAHKDRKRGVTSTPKCGNADIIRDEVSGLEFWKRMPPEDIESPIWRVWQRGTMHHFAWPCPECATYFVPRFKQLRIPENATSAEAKRHAHVECPHCGGVIEEHHKPDLNARGRYVAPGQEISPDGIVTGDPPDTSTISFWVSGICSPFVTIGERAAAYIEAKESGSQEKLQAVINTGFGELWAPGAGDVPEWTEVAALRRPYKKLEIPVGVRVLTLAADVQKRRIVYTIRGWGARGSSWLIDFGELHGHTTEDDVWNDFAELLHRPIEDRAIRMAFIDSGFRPGKPENVPVNKVYDFCRRFPRLVYPTKGRATQDKPLIPSKIEVTARGSARKYGLDLIWLDTDHFKSWVHERIRWEPNQPGAWLLPQDTTDDYCKQIVAEARVKKPNGQPQWVARSRENHYLDCEAMQAAVGHMLSVHLMRPDDTESASPPPPTPAEPAPAAGNVAQAAQRARAEKPQTPSKPIVAPRALASKVDAAAARKQRIQDLAVRMRTR